MKKILALCLALTMALAVFAGCSGAASSSAPAAGSASGSASTGGSATGKQLSGKVVYWSMYNEGEPEAMAIQKAADMFMEDYPDCEVEIQWIGRSNQDITGPALEGGEQLDILDNFSYDKSTDRYLDITDMMNEPALGQEDMTVAESILPVLNLANAQGQEKAGLETDKYYGVQMFPWVVGFFYNKDLFQQAGITETPETWTEFMEACQKLKDAGYYLIGRITVFNDAHLAADHPEYVISDLDGTPLKISSMYWPSAYNRTVWQYKVDLALEAASLGFNEIQFDYIRFPDGAYRYEKAGTIDYRNTYGESKAQAVQRFLLYAAERLHGAGYYLSGDVFGECANPYVTACGQYWPAISAAVDAISGMPYPDHYSAQGDYKPWEHPYDTVHMFGAAAAERQKETVSPAAVRTWIQAYNALWEPYNTYGAAEIAAEVKALRDTGCTGGFMTWNGGSDINKYQSIISALR